MTAGAAPAEHAARLGPRANQVALCLEVDGTLSPSPIVPDPEAAGCYLAWSSCSGRSSVVNGQTACARARMLQQDSWSVSRISASCQKLCSPVGFVNSGRGEAQLLAIRGRSLLGSTVLSGNSCRLPTHLP